MTTPAPTPSVIVVRTPKSVGIALILTFLFGPLGLLYASVVGGLVMMAVSLVVALLTLGFGLLITWPICLVWAVIATKRHNAQLAAAPLPYTT